MSDLEKWYKANGIDIEETSAFGLNPPPLSQVLTLDVENAIRNYKASGEELNAFNNIDYVFRRGDVKDAFNSMKNTIDFAKSEEGRRILKNVSDLRDAYEVSKIRADFWNDDEGYEAQLDDWVKDRLERVSNPVEKRYRARELASNIKIWENEYGRDLATSGNYYIARDDNGNFNYVYGDPKLHAEAPHTTGELINAIAGELSKKSPVRSSDLSQLFNYARTGRRTPSPSFSGGGHWLRDSMLERSGKMFTDDEFESKNGGMGRALAGDISQLALMALPYERTVELGLRAIPKISGVFRALDRAENASRLTAVGSKFTKGAIDNTAALAVGNVAGDVYDKAMGTNRGTYLDTFPSYVINAMLGGVGKTFGKYPKSRDEINNDIFKYLMSKSPRGTEVVGNTGIVINGKPINTPNDITDELRDLWFGRVSESQVLNRQLEPFNEEVVRFNQNLKPDARLETKEVEFYDPNAIQQAARKADEENARRSAEWQRNYERTFEKNQNAVLDAQHQQNMINGRRQFKAEMEAEGAYNDLVAEAQAEFENAVANNDYWRERFDKSNSDYWKTFWEYAQNRRNYQGVMDSFKDTDFEKDVFEQISKETGVPYNPSTGFTDEQLKDILDRKILTPNAETAIRNLMARRGAGESASTALATPNLMRGETRAAIEKEAFKPTIPQSVSDEQSIATGAYEASQKRLQDATKDLKDAQSTPIGEVNAETVQVTPNLEILPNRRTAELRPVKVKIGDNSPTAKRRMKIRVQSYDEKPMTEAEFRKYANEHWQEWEGVSSADDLYKHPNREQIKELLSESYKRGASSTEPVTDAEWRAFAEDNWRELGGDRLVDGRVERGKYRNADDMYNDKRARRWFEDKYSHLYRTNRTPNPNPQERSYLYNNNVFDESYRTTNKDVRTQASRLSEHAKDNRFGTGGKDQTLADFMRIASQIEDPEKEAAFRKVLKENAKMRQYVTGMGKAAASRNPEYNYVIPTDKSESKLGILRGVTKYSLPTVGRTFSSPYHFEDIPGQLKTVVPTDENYK